MSLVRESLTFYLSGHVAFRRSVVADSVRSSGRRGVDIFQGTIIREFPS